MPTTAAPAATHRVPIWTVVLASLGVFMTALDTLVVATALPTLHTDLGASLVDLEWTVNSYNLAFACLILTGAALGDRYGRRRMYAVGLGVFTLASALAALAPDATTLIVARALQGVGAAVVLPLTLTLISDAFPSKRRGVAIGLWGGLSGAAVAAGPVVGGVIVDGLSWQWIFWLNVPVGIALIPLSLWRLRESHGPRPHLDVPGLALAALGLFALTWGAVRAPSVGWGSGEVVTTLVAGFVLMVAFLAWERRAPHPMLPLHYFRRRAFATANGVIFFQFVSLFGALFMIAQLFQNALGNSPLEAGLRILPWTGMPMIVAPIAGALADRFGNRPFMVVGIGLQAIGLAWLATIVTPGVGYGELSPALVVAGVGIGMCFPTVANAVVSSVPLAETGVASAANNALRELGAVFGVAVIGAVFAHNGGYGSPERFVDGFVPALYVAAALAAVGLIAAVMAPGRGDAGPTREPVHEDATASGRRYRSGAVHR